MEEKGRFWSAATMLPRSVLLSFSKIAISGMWTYMRADADGRGQLVGRTEKSFEIPPILQLAATVVRVYQALSISGQNALNLS